jgi:hypothetical protein
MWQSWEATAQVRQRQEYAPIGESIWEAYRQGIMFGEQNANTEEKKWARKEFNEFYATLRKPFLLGERW